MTSRVPYKPEGWPTADDLALMSSQEVKEHLDELRRAVDKFEELNHDFMNGFDSEREAAAQRLVIAYRALKAWEAGRR